MASLIDIRVDGAADVQRMLRRAEEATGRKAVQTGLKAGALIVENDAKRRAPYRTGTLRRSISNADSGQLAVKIGTDVPYAARLEYGFVGRDSRGRRYNQPARPYLRPALNENREEVREAVLQVIRSKLRGVA